MKQKIYRRVITYINRLLSVVALFVAFFSFLFVSTPVNVYAQEVGFSECQFNPETQSSDGASIQNCLGQIFQFTFVVGMFIIAIRVALFALGNYNPFDNGKAINNTINIVWEATLGFILLGSPVLIINVINPAALNLSFLQIGGIIANQGGGGGSNTGTGGSGGSGGSGVGSTTTSGGGSGGGGNSITGGSGPVTAGQGNEACEVAGSDTCTQAGSFLNPFAPVTTYAQDGMSQTEAIRVITEILRAESECKKIFIRNTDYQNCLSLDQPDFVAVRNRFTPRARELYTPLTELSKDFSGGTHISRPVEVLPLAIEPSNTPDSGCTLEYAVLRETAASNRYVVATQNCPDAEAVTPIWNVEDGVYTLQTGVVLEAGTEILRSGSIQILTS